MLGPDFARHLLLNATTVQEVTAILKDLQSPKEGTKVNTAWRPVGGIDNNLAIINLGSDPAAGVIERVTNALDAILEREWIERKQPAHLMSPRSAVEPWFGIKDGHLSNITRDGVRKLEVAKRVRVTLRDSDRDDKPTVDIRDYGIGLLAEEFSETILSLNKNRKLRKLFLAGAFGQGGSTALAYSPFTVFFSRKMTPAGLAPSPVAFTLVRFNPGDPEVDKHGVYEYMVDAKNGQPLTLDLSLDEFPAGTLVRHLTMEVGKYSAVLTAPTGSLWFLAHNYLFDPVLPFSIADERSGRDASVRTVTGNARLLTQGEHTQYQRSATLTFRDGAVVLNWWVLSGEGENARGRLTQYVAISKPIIVTYNGQKQGDFPNTVIKDDLKLPYLDRFLIVHVDCDRLDAESRRQLFPTTREALRDTPIGDDLRRLVVDTLHGDETLRVLDRERKRRYLKQDSDAAIDNIRKRLASRVQSFASAHGDGTLPSVTPPEPSPGPDKPDPIPCQEPPTFIRITNGDPRNIYSGRTFTLKFETDARPEYFATPDHFLAVVTPPGVAQYSGNTNVRAGYGIAYFRASENLATGTTGKITLEVRPPHAQSLNATIHVEVVDLPQTSAPGEGSGKTPNINPHWITRDDAFWSDNGWDESSVAKVTREEDAVDIYVSADNARLSQIIARAQRKDVEAVETVKSFYLEHISFFAYLEDLARTNSAKGAALPELEDDGVHEESLQHACETICGIVEGMFNVLISPT